MNHFLVPRVINAGAGSFSRPLKYFTNRIGQVADHDATATAAFAGPD